jgi:hypothetical protein
MNIDCLFRIQTYFWWMYYPEVKYIVMSSRKYDCIWITFVFLTRFSI